jgi:NAD(P)-dependent dehydrogenase (short-subunit alcohol dehydrogenase family)
MTTVSDKVAVITGANGGLGYQTALELARMGMSVVMACRNVDRARKAQAELLAEVPDAEATVIPLDVSEPDSIREFGRQLSAQVGRLDLLINNAGIVLVPLVRNSVGQELHLATNHLGAFSLTGTLLPLFPGNAQARIVNVVSLAHRFAKLDLDDLNWEKTPYSEWRAYARSKLLLLSFTMELDRRLRHRQQRRRRGRPSWIRQHERGQGQRRVDAHDLVPPVVQREGGGAADPQGAGGSPAHRPCRQRRGRERRGLLRSDGSSGDRWKDRTSARQSHREGHRRWKARMGLVRRDDGGPVPFFALGLPDPSAMPTGLRGSRSEPS